LRAQFSGPVSVFHDRRLPETAIPAPVYIDEEQIGQNNFIKQAQFFLRKYPNGNLITGAETFRLYNNRATPTAVPSPWGGDQYADHDEDDRPGRGDQVLDGEQEELEKSGHGVGRRACRCGWQFMLREADRRIEWGRPPRAGSTPFRHTVS